MADGTPEPRPRWFLAYAQVVPALAALDTVLVRIERPTWEVELGLFGGMLLLWAALGLAALVPAALVGRLVRGRLSAPALLTACLALPLVGHVTLDSFTDLGAGLSSLMRPMP